MGLEPGDFRPCSECQEQAGNEACPECEGLGFVLLADPRGLGETPSWMEVVGLLMPMFAAVRRGRLAAWMRMEGIRRLDPLAAEAVGVLEREYEAAVFERRKGEADRARSQRQCKRS